MTSAAFGAVVGLLVRGAVRNSGYGSRFFTPEAVRGLMGEWTSTWTEPNAVGAPTPCCETITINSVNGGRIRGIATSPLYADKPCALEGALFAERFLFLLWRPTADVRKQHGIVDYGCYFLERQAGGHFVGIAVGFHFRLGRIAAFDHVVRRPGASAQPTQPEDAGRRAA
jgi:hypothetical protein